MPSRKSSCTIMSYSNLLNLANICSFHLRAHNNCKYTLNFIDLFIKWSGQQGQYWERWRWILSTWKTNNMNSDNEGCRLLRKANLLLPTLTLQCCLYFIHPLLLIMTILCWSGHTLNLSTAALSKLSVLLWSFTSSVLPFSPYICRKTLELVPAPFKSLVQTVTSYGMAAHREVFDRQ